MIARLSYVFIITCDQALVSLLLQRYSTHPWVSPCGPAIGCSNLILSNLSGLLRSTNPFPMNLFLFVQKREPKKHALGTRAPHTRMQRSVIREFPAALKSPGFHFIASRLQQVVLTRHPGCDKFPVKFAEVFGFGKENQAGRLI
jgi:hypothetical protein